MGVQALHNAILDWKQKDNYIHHILYLYLGGYKLNRHFIVDTNYKKLLVFC